MILAVGLFVGNYYQFGNVIFFSSWGIFILNGCRMLLNAFSALINMIM
jgi:hypothetical protein